MRIAEDAVWRYYNCPDSQWSARCRSCREKVALSQVPIPECVNCWKVEIWKHGTAFREHPGFEFDGLMDGLEASILNRKPEVPDESAVKAISAKAISTEAAPAGPVIAKASRAPIQVVRTGIPASGYGGLVVDDLLLLYSKSISEREALRDLVTVALGLPEEAGALIPVRRGCWRFDRILGPWQRWYRMNEDWT